MPQAAWGSVCVPGAPDGYFTLHERFGSKRHNDARSYKWGISLNGTASNISKFRRPTSAVFPSVLE
jgi:hypothetical protein